MNLRGGLALIKKSLLSFMASRGFFWTLTLGWMMGPLVYLFVWTVAVGQGSIAGFQRNDFIFYYLSLIFVNQLTYPTSHWTVGDQIQIGTISTWLLRPLPVIYEAIGADLAVKIVTMPFVLLITIGLGILLKCQLTLSLVTLFFFFSSLILAQILRFLFAYTLALLAFWTQRIQSLLAINDTFVFLFAGQVAPVALLPGVIKQLAVILPFRSMLGFPIELLVNKLTLPEMITGFIYQAIWIILVISAQQIIWRLGRRQYMMIGG